MSELFLDCIKRIKEIKQLHTDSQVAKELGITKNNLYAFKNRASLPIKHLHTFCSREGIRLDYIMEGTLPVYENQRHVVAEPQATYSPASAEAPTQQVTIPNLIQKTIVILESKSVYSTALRSNIESFHYAITREEALALANKRIDELEEEVTDIKTRLPAVGE